jgi:PAS domain S-box-containing protein
MGGSRSAKNSAPAESPAEAPFHPLQDGYRFQSRDEIHVTRRSADRAGVSRSLSLADPPAPPPLDRGAELLDDSSSRLASIVDSSFDAIIGKDLNGTVTSWNPAAETMYGYRADEMIGRSIEVLAPPDRRTEFLDIIQRIARGEMVDRYETVRVHKDGRLIRASLAVWPIRSSYGTITGASVIARDMTELHSWQQTLLASVERYRVLFEQNPAPMWVYDPETLCFLDVNEAATVHYGYGREEFLSMTIKDIRPQEDVPKLVAAIEAGERGDVWRHRKKDGTVFDVEILSSDLHLNDAQARLVIAKDITERAQLVRDLRKAYESERAAATRLRHLDEMKNAFLNAVSHELRTPLSVVVGSAATLERLGLDLTLEDQRDLLRAVIANALKLQAMLSDLLDLDRLTRGVLRPKLAATELEGLVRRVVEDSAFTDRRVVQVQGSAMVLPVDAPKVERILENLLANAVKYSPEGTPIFVRVERVPEGAILSVEDSGPGVPEDIRESIFEPFRQGANASAHSPGVGIGLSLVARFAELHGGRAWWEARQGGGSCFRVLLRDPTAPRAGESG